MYNDEEIRKYLEQQYGAASDSSGVSDAISRQQSQNTMADIGSGLDRMFTAESAAYGGQGANNAYWQGMKQDASERVKQAEADRDNKIKDFVQRANMGRQAAQDSMARQEFETKQQMYDPNSEASKRVAAAYSKMYPKADFSGLAASEVGDYQRALGEQAKAEEQRRQFNAEFGLKNKEFGIKEKQAQTPVTQKAAQEALDKDYVKDFNDWTSNGRPAYENNLALLKQAKAELLKENDEKSTVSGRDVAAKGNVWRGSRDNASLRIESNVRKASQGALRSTLGSQFTEKEGERIMNNAYDVMLPPSENIKKIDAAIAELESRAIVNDAKARHFQQKGTLWGWQDQKIGKSPEQEQADNMLGDDMARQWALAHPDDPRAKEILQYTGVK